MLSTTTVRAVNSLTERWARGVPTAGGTVFTAAGLWPLLAALASGADGAAGKELADALGVPAGQAAERARELLGVLGRLPGVAAAVGLWTVPALQVSPEWTAGLPAHLHQPITGPEIQPQLDAWAARHTNGQIEEFPLRVQPDTLLLLASALAVRTDWIRPFEPTFFSAETGPWAGREFAGLYRLTSLLDRVAVVETPAGPVSELRVLGGGGIDVHLLVGEEGARPGEVLAGGLGILTGRHRRVTGGQLPYGEAGPGVRVRAIRSEVPQHELLAEVVQFTVAAEHDLLADADRFGLGTVSRREPDGTGHLPGICADPPLEVRAAAQSATATFGALGFRAAAVTAFGIAVGSAPTPPPYRVRRVSFTTDRPFGFLAVHRTSRLVLAAGWVDRPDPYEREPEEWDEEE
ncbi:serpin family protein [Streptomyces sp. NRRL B-24484]|uniref:serpin family protein n=1 Tax=Streptomyces sp. NRRL B-24484 TaxID=1463833 RepID=UPI0004C16681|nr:serpin family protein [Streptomyces sp. NRRL B-24484]